MTLVSSFSSDQSLSRVRLFATRWTTARQASLSNTNPRSPPKLMSIESLMPFTISASVFPFSSCLQSFPASGSFPMSQLFTSGGQSTGTSASTSVLPMNISGWFPLGLTGLISLQPKGLSRVFSNTAVRKHQFFRRSAFLMVQLSYLYMTIEKTIALTIQTFVSKVMSLLLITLAKANTS